MSEPQTSPPQAPPSELDEVKKQLALMTEENRKLKAAKTRKKESEQPKEQTNSNLPQTPQTAPTPSEQHEHTHTEEPEQDHIIKDCPTCGRTESKGKHLLRTFDKFCPEGNCGQPNPYFKDETECPSCRAHLGSVETVKKLPLCPHCGYRGKVNRL